MKPFLVFLTVLCSINVLIAQETAPKPKKNILGGTFFFNVNKNGQAANSIIFTPSGPITIFGDEITSTNFSLSPYYARQIGDSWMLGIRMNYNISIVKGDDNFVFGPNRQENTGWKVGVFGRYTFFPDNKFSLFIQPGLNYTKQYFKSSSTFDEFENNVVSGVEFLASPGASLQLGYNFQLIANFGRIGAAFGNQMDQLSGRTIQFNSFFTDFSFSSFALGAEMRF